MKIVKLVAVATVVTALFVGCDSSTGSETETPQDAKSVVDSINVDYKGENSAVFYKFSSQTQTEVKHDVWDIAIDGSLNIVSNSGDYGYGVAVFPTTSTNFDDDFTSYADSSFGEIKNISFADNNPFDGWMNMSAMPPSYPGTVFIIKTEDGVFYKFQINSATMRTGVSLTTKIDALNGTGAVESVFTKDESYDYAYIDLGTKATVSFASKTAEWDVKFARGQQKTKMEDGSFVPYGMSAISINTAGSVTAYTIENRKLEDVTTIETGSLNDSVNVIGNSWYTFSGRPDMIFTCDEDVSVIATSAGTFKLQMATFYGGADGGKQFSSIFEFQEMK